MTTPATNNTASIARPPIVVIMGHIDHGKTTILDWYRKSAIAASESGGITQHVGAYEVEHAGKKTTFIDTPGHEAFSNIRSRGATIADIAIVVIAADESVKSQTREALDIVKRHNLPFIIAVNKIDKPEANPERVKQDLTKEDVLVESYSGKIPSVEISAKTGAHMDDLLETVTLLAEMENLTSDPLSPARGVVVETHRDAQRGTTATLLVRDGSIKRGAICAIGRSPEMIKILEDFRGEPITEAGPSSPVRTAGIVHMPSVGDEFRCFDSKSAAQLYSDALPALQSRPSAPIPSPENTFIINIILKTDVAGSKEALEKSLKQIAPDRITIRLIRSDMGNINEDDVKMAIATRMVSIVGFKVRVDASSAELAKKFNVAIITGDVIYRLLDDVRAHIQDVLPPIVERVELGTIKILKLFGKEGTKQIVGGKVEAGAVKKSALTEIKRNRETVGRGRIAQIRRGKNEVEEVGQGTECGVMVDADITIREGDMLELYQHNTIKHAL